MVKRAAKKKIAILDIDGTIFRSSLQRELLMSLVRFGVFPPIVRKELEKNYFAWVHRAGSYEDYINGVVKSYQNRINGVLVSDVKRVANILIEQQKFRVYTYTRELIKELRHDYRLIAISGSPIEIVKEFNKIWKFDAVYGTVFEVKDERYTGTVKFLPIKDKRSVVEQYVAEENLSLKDSIGIGDTESDASFLEIVKKPICFNPNQALYKIAKKKKWDIVVERKDVIYHL
ncbi:MAG: HAD-IB family phosphatase [Patescibacteria group bacterium]